MKELVIERLNDRGVKLDSISAVVYKLQKPYSNDLTIEECKDAVEHVLEKREVQYTILTGVALDKLAEDNKLEEPLAEIIKKDEPLYGVDESLAFAISSIYGTVGFTSFGYLDKHKMGIMKELDTSEDNVNTFLDDLVAGVAAAASAKIAHRKQTELNKEKELEELQQSSNKQSI
ncbi:MAG: phosphatidylglycerophosphatase A family protein [Bacillota bacterium]